MTSDNPIQPAQLLAAAYTALDTAQYDLAAALCRVLQLLDDQAATVMANPPTRMVPMLRLAHRDEQPARPRREAVPTCSTCGDTVKILRTHDKGVCERDMDCEHVSIGHLDPSDHEPTLARYACSICEGLVTIAKDDGRVRHVEEPRHPHGAILDV